MTVQILASQPLDFTCLPRKTTTFGAEHVLPAPALAHSAHFTLWHDESASTAGHRIPERTDRNTAEEARKERGRSRGVRALLSLFFGPW